MLWGRMIQKTCPHRFSRSVNKTVLKEWDVLYRFRIRPPVIHPRHAYECYQRFGAGTSLVWCSTMLVYTQMVHCHSLACILSPTRCSRQRSPLREVHVVTWRYLKPILTHGGSVTCLTVDYRGHGMHLMPNHMVPQFPNAVAAMAWEQQAIECST